MTQDRIDRMKKGGRLDPDLPHKFMPSGGDELIGGAVYRSRACGICGGSWQNPVHTDAADAFVQRSSWPVR